MPRKQKREVIYNGSIYTCSTSKDDARPSGKREVTVTEVEATIIEVEERARHEIEAIEVNEFKDIGERFIKNMDMIDLLVVLPITICASDAAEMKKLVWEIGTRLKSGVLFPNKADKVRMEKYLEEKQRLFQSEIEPAGEELATKIMKEGEVRFISILADDFVSRPYRALLYSALVWIWCNFEVIMKDLWEAALNSAGKNVVKDILKSVSQKKGASDKILGKSITLDYLAKFDYNLSKRLGTALLSKFDFDSLSGLREAYVAAFPRSTTIKRALESETLGELEAKRNLVAHRAALIDAKYCDKTNTSRTKIGKELEISSMGIKKLNVEVLDCVNNILKAVSSIVVASSMDRKST